jgi:hypothetical protein
LRQVETWTDALPTALRQAILKGTAPGRSIDVLVTAVRMSDELASYLATLIGYEGALALVRRSLALTRREQGWLADALVGVATPSLSDARVVAAAELESAERVQETSVTLLTHLVNLLVGFIGERLTLQVLRQIWPEVASTLVKNKELP